MNRHRGYTLVELIVAVGLFALVMMLASGAYFMMINLNRQTQGIATGINNLSFALETMTRSIRAGTAYNCAGLGDCPNGAGSFSFTNVQGAAMSYTLVGAAIRRTVDGVGSVLTDPSVTISSLTFYAFGTGQPPSDYEQSRVTIVVSGTVSSGPGKVQPFTVETGATMRGSDIGNSSPPPPPPPPPPPVGSCGIGGTVVEREGFCIHTFIASGTFIPSATVSSVDVMVVGGGGGGGTWCEGSDPGSGGGGAGGLVYKSGYSISTKSYAVTVGNGGAGANNCANGPSDNQNGGDSVFDSFTAKGGGGGGTWTNIGSSIGKSGGSGGGGAYGDDGGNSTQASYGGSGFGMKGAASSGGTFGGGGGGAATAGNGTDGGNGKRYSITGGSYYYAAGGGGGARIGNTPGGGGLGGGGNGGTSTNGADGGVNTGGGGGGSSSGNGGTGADGIVVIRYLKP